MTRSLAAAFWPLLGLVPYALLQARFLARLRSAPDALGGAPGSAAAWRRYVSRRALGSVTAALFWIACVVASSGTLRLPRYVSEPVAGAAVSFVVDVSNSMLTDDGTGRRLDAATGFAGRAASASGGASLALVAFRGMPVTLCPSTKDRRAFEDALRWAGPAVTTAAGSDVGAAIDEAARTTSATGTARVIVVLSDGNDTGQDARAASGRAADAGIVMAFVGFGGSGRLPVQDSSGTPVRGADGEVAETALDASAMRDWAVSGRGTFVRADDPDAFARIAGICDAASSRSGRRHTVRVEVDAFPALAFAALAMLGLSAALSRPPTVRTVRTADHRAGHRSGTRRRRIDA